MCDSRLRPNRRSRRFAQIRRANASFEIAIHIGLKLIPFGVGEYQPEGANGCPNRHLTLNLQLLKELGRDALPLGHFGGNGALLLGVHLAKLGDGSRDRIRHLGQSRHRDFLSGGNPGQEELISGCIRRAVLIDVLCQIGVEMQEAEPNIQVLWGLIYEIWHWRRCLSDSQKPASNRYCYQQADSHGIGGGHSRCFRVSRPA